jgi:insertion element IS1 protein InsB
MCEITTTVGCPHCHSAKVVKNGEKNTGAQNFLCRGCGKQFQYVYKDKGANPDVKRLILSMLLRNCGIRDVGAVLGVRRNSVLNVLLRAAGKCALVPKLSRYRSVQVDEFWSYVHQKKKKKRWLIYAYAPETDEILAYAIGDRGAKTVKRLYKMLKGLTIDEFCTDDWAAFGKVFSGENHQVGKHPTRHIEGTIKIMVQQRNYAYHTF